MSLPIQDATIGPLQRKLGRLSTQAAVVAANLANVDTPGYRALRAEFRDTLDVAAGREGARTDARHLGAGGPDDPVTLVEASVMRARLDGNTVDIDREMTLLATLQGRYRAAAQMIKKRFALMRYAASDGRS